MSATKSQDWTVYWAISIKLTSLKQTRFFFVALRPNAGQGLLIHEVSRSHTTTRNSRQDSSGRVIGSSQRPIPDNTQHSQQTNIHAPGGILTHVVSRRAAADLRLRPRGHWDWQLTRFPPQNKTTQSAHQVLSSVNQTAQNNSKE